MRFTLVVLPVLLFLGSCTFPFGAKSDFLSLYQAHIVAQVGSIREVAEHMGYMESYQMNGSLGIGVDIPAILSGSVSTEYDVKVRAQDAHFVFQNPSLQYETLLASGSFLARQIDMITHGGDAFFRYDGLSGVGLLDASLAPIIDQYKNKWLSISAAEYDAASLSGVSDDERASYKMSEAIARMSLSDIEDYLVKYPLYKEEKSLGMSGSLAGYEVSLAKENIVALFSDFYKKSTSKDISSEQVASLNEMLKNIDIRGTVYMDPKNARVIVFDANISMPESDTIRVSLNSGTENTDISIAAYGTTLSWSSQKKDDAYNLTIITKDADREVARITGKLSYRDHRFSSMDMTFAALEQGLTVTLKHEKTADGFVGSLNAGIGSLSWDWKTKDDTLTEFKLTGAMLGSALDMDLKPGADGRLTGPLTLKSGETLLASANVGLRANKKEFTLTLDIMSPEDPSIVSRANITIKADRAPWKGDIEIPTSTERFQDFTDALSKVLSPVSGFQEVSESDTLSDN